MIAISKGPERNAGKEFYHQAGKESFALPFASPLAFYMQNIRDEAHRFGITFHRNKRSAGFVRTQLEEIEGIGTKTADLLLRRFRSVARIRRASEEELADAVGTAKARRVYAYFHDGTPAPDRPGEDDGAGESPTANGASDA